MRSIIIISYYNHYHCCHLYSGVMFMRSVIIEHRPKLAVLPKLVFNAQKPVANSIATANQRIIASCNPTCLPKNYIYERVAQETTTRKMMHPPIVLHKQEDPIFLLPDCVFHQNCSFLLLASQHPLLVFPLSSNILSLSTQFFFDDLLGNHGVFYPQNIWVSRVSRQVTNQTIYSNL